MSDFEESFHHERLIEEILCLLIDGKLYPGDIKEKYEFNRRAILRDIKHIRNIFYNKYGDDVSVVYNAKDKCYELLVIKGSISIIDLPYGF